MKTKPFPKTLIVFCKFSVLRQQHQWIVFSRECTAVIIQRNTRPTLHILKTWGTETVLKRPKKCKYRWERTCKLTCKFTLIREQSGTGPTTTVTLFFPWEAVWAKMTSTAASMSAQKTTVPERTTAKHRCMNEERWGQWQYHCTKHTHDCHVPQDRRC